MQDEIIIIGGGFAGCEAAWGAAQRGSRVTLYEMRPNRKTPVHQTGDLAELVCSNSFKSNLLTNASGVLKEEMRRLGSLLLPLAAKHGVPAGEALAVDREPFAREVTETLERHPNITIIREEVTEIPAHRPLILATGPLTSDALAAEIAKLTGGDSLSFYDAVAPTVTADSLDYTKVFRASRRGKGAGEAGKEEGCRVSGVGCQEEDTGAAGENEGQQSESAGADFRHPTPDARTPSEGIGCGGAPVESADYLNCPMEKDEYMAFWQAINDAELASAARFRTERHRTQNGLFRDVRAARRTGAARAENAGIRPDETDWPA